MPVISKQLFYEKVGKRVKCNELHYWNPNCALANLSLSYNVLWGSLKFFVPIYVIKIIIDRKKIKNKSFWKQMIIQEIRSGLYGVLIGTLFLGSNCLLCKLTGRVNYYNLGLISPFVSGLGLLIETKENQILDTLIFFNLLVEAAFRNCEQFGRIKLTPLKETVAFMLTSSLLMHLLQNRCENRLRHATLWFYTPDRLSNNLSQLKCGGSAILSITRKYFLLGYGFSAIRKLIPIMLTIVRKPSNLYKALVNTDNVRFGCFIGAYVGVYKYIVCTLLKSENVFYRKYAGSIAGLASGLTYSISPNLQVLTVGMTTVLQILYNSALEQLDVKRHIIPQQLIYIIAHGLLMFNALYSKETCPNYYLNMLDTSTNNMFLKIHRNIFHKYIL